MVKRILSHEKYFGRSSINQKQLTSESYSQSCETCDRRIGSTLLLKHVMSGDIRTQYRKGPHFFVVGKLSTKILSFNIFHSLSRFFINRTNCQIQQTIRKHFCDCTVLTISHRLNTVVDCDRIMVSVSRVFPSLLSGVYTWQFWSRLSIHLQTS